MRIFYRAGKYLKPYQGLKPEDCGELVTFNLGRKIPKTLSGIETIAWKILMQLYRAGKYLKPYQGLKLLIHDRQTAVRPSRKIPKTLSGIET